MFVPVILLGLLLICWPGAGWLQVRKAWITPEADPNAVYLVCGASAQDRRVAALANWLKLHAGSTNSTLPIVLIGNDPQKNRWCRQHQTNHTVTAWAIEKLDLALAELPVEYSPVVVPGEFSTTDGEMQALASYLREHSQIESVALVTSRYHARRCLERLQAHISTEVEIGFIRGLHNWRNRSPLRVVSEYLKIWRDRIGLSDMPVISRTNKSDVVRD